MSPHRLEFTKALTFCYDLAPTGGETALDIAKENGKAEVVRLLADPTAYTAQGHGVRSDGGRGEQAHARPGARACCTVS